MNNNNVILLTRETQRKMKYKIIEKKNVHFYGEIENT